MQLIYYDEPPLPSPLPFHHDGLYKFRRIPPRAAQPRQLVLCRATTDTHGSRQAMEVQPELSLGPTSLGGFAAMKSPRSSSSDSDGGGAGKKRKHFAWEEAVSHAGSLDLQLGDPLPLDWEQCLDLHSGRMYYLNRKTMKKSWVRPSSKEEQEQGALNLELNISTTPSSCTFGESKANAYRSVASGGGHMVAVPCVNCHLLVMLCKSSPACPNCKFVQPSSVPAMPQTPLPRRLDAAVKPLETLSLLH